MTQSETLEPFVRKLERLGPLAPDVRDAILALRSTGRTFAPGDLLLREGAPATHSVVITSGFAFRHKTLADGGRQILSIQIPGDGVALVAALGRRSDYDLQGLTHGHATSIPTDAIRALMDAHPQVMAALWAETAAEAAIQREWTVNVGRRDARARIAHLLCELAERQASATQQARDRFELPLSQEQLGDATGLTAVHVNRMLQALTEEDAIRRDRRRITVPSWPRLAAIAGFEPDYLRTATGSIA
ncbi:MAG: Crp/Fnr family transcriptional regulator [Janthinobacterium lividum]